MNFRMFVGNGININFLGCENTLKYVHQRIFEKVNGKQVLRKKKNPAIHVFNISGTKNKHLLTPFFLIKFFLNITLRFLLYLHFLKFHFVYLKGRVGKKSKDREEVLHLLVHSCMAKQPRLGQHKAESWDTMGSPVEGLGPEHLGHLPPLSQVH